MKLCDARIDSWGQIVALGRLTFIGDPNGRFVPIEHDCLRMAARGSRIRLAAATASRDGTTGFLVASEVLPVVFLPRSLSLLIQDALEHQPSGSVTATLAKQEGELLSDNSSETWSQPLSDWKLEVVANGGDIEFELSAALLAIDSLKNWQKRTENHWLLSDHEIPRLQIGFCVDAVTRIALFGARLPELAEESILFDRPRVHKTTAANPRLEHAPVGIYGEIFGYAKDGSWVSIVEGGPESTTIAIERYNPQRRLSNGFVSVEKRHRWPRIWFSGLDINRMIQILLGNGNKGSMELKEGWFGHLAVGRQDDNPGISIGRVSIDLHLTALGLEFSYVLSRSENRALCQLSSELGPWSDSFIIPWEILILRYPRLADFRLRIASHPPAPDLL